MEAYPLMGTLGEEARVGMECRQGRSCSGYVPSLGEPANCQWDSLASG